MGDRAVELGVFVCKEDAEYSPTSHFVNPGRLIFPEAQQVHGISDKEVSDCQPCEKIAEEVGLLVIDS